MRVFRIPWPVPWRILTFPAENWTASSKKYVTACVVAVGPICHFFAIDFYMCVAHCSVKDKRYTATDSICHVKCSAVCAFSNERQPSCTTGFYGFFLFSILLYSYSLQVVFSVKRPVNGPVMRYAYLLPAGSGVRCTFGKFPAVVECRDYSFGMNIDCNGSCKSHYNCYKISDHNVI